MFLFFNNGHLFFPAAGVLSALLFSPVLARWLILTEVLFSIAFEFRAGVLPMEQGKYFSLLAAVLIFIAVGGNRNFSTKVQTIGVAGTQLCLAIFFTASSFQTLAVSLAAYSFLLFILGALGTSAVFRELSIWGLLGSFLLVIASCLAPASGPTAALAFLSAALLGPVAPASLGLRSLLKGTNLPAKVLAVGAGPLVSFWAVKNSGIQTSFSADWLVVVAGICHLFSGWLAWESRRWSDWLAAATSATVSFLCLGILSEPSFDRGPAGGAALCASILVFVFHWIESQVPEGSLGDSGTLRRLPLASILIVLSFVGLLGFPQWKALPESAIGILVSVALTWACLAISGLRLLLPLFLSAPSELTTPKDTGVIPFLLGLAFCAAALSVRYL